MKQDVKEIKEGMSTMSKCLERIEVDLRHHIKRSDKHEGWMMKIIIVLAGGAGAGLLKIVPYLTALMP